MNVLKNLKVKTKLILLIVLASILTAAIGLTGLTYMQDMAKDTKSMYEDQLQPIRSLGKIRANNKAVDSYLLESMITEDQAYTEQLNKQMDELVKENMAMEKPELFDAKTVDAETYGQVADAFTQARKKVAELTVQNKNKEAYKLYTTELKAASEKFDEAVIKLRNAHEKRAADVNKENNENTDTITLVFFIVIVLGIGVLILIGLVIARMITKPLSEIGDLMKKAEAGDFTERGSYQAKDELGQLTTSFNHMVGSITQTIQTVNENAEMVVASSAQLSASAEQSTEASSHIASTIQELALGSEQQLRSVEESNHIIQEISGYAEQINDNTAEVSKSADISTTLSVEGDKVIKQMIQQMQEINTNVQGLSQSVQALSDRSTEIGNINAVITNIADQTNLLALNAAIEAARAGEHGKGFAVVADEVRNLAEQSVQSADQIKKLIETIQSDTNEALSNMESTTKGVAVGIEVAETAGNAFNQIEESIKGVSSQFADVAAAITDLAKGTQRVAASMIAVKEVAENAAASSQTVSAGTEEQLASMEEISTSATSLATISDELQHTVRRFKLK